MKFFGAIIFFLIAFLVVMAMIALIFLRRLFLRLRQHLTGDYDEETVRRMSDKYYKGDGDGPQFDKDYFKGTGSSRQYRGNQQERKRPQESRRTTTAAGITIIDERSREEAERKIFTQDEGEYVDFVEEKD